MPAWNGGATSTVSVSAGATLAVYVDPTSGYNVLSATDLDSLLAGNAGTNTGAVTWSNGSILGIDTTRESFLGFTYGNITSTPRRQPRPDEARRQSVGPQPHEHL